MSFSRFLPVLWTPDSQWSSWSHAPKVTKIWRSPPRMLEIYICPNQAKDGLPFPREQKLSSISPAKVKFHFSSFLEYLTTFNPTAGLPLRRVKQELTTANRYSLILTNVCRRSPLSVMTSVFPYRWGGWQAEHPEGHATQLCLNSPFLRYHWLKTPSSIPDSPCDPLQNTPGQISLAPEESSPPHHTGDTYRVPMILALEASGRNKTRVTP